MTDRWVPNTAGEDLLMHELADRFDNFAQYVVERVRETEISLERYHSARAGRRYVDSIHQATYLNGELVGGTDVKGVGNVARRTIHSVIYSTSFLAHMLEVTGAKPHDIALDVQHGPFAQVILHHPGFTRRPHFVPGLLSAASEVGAKMRGKTIVGRSEAARLAGRPR